MKSLKTYAIPFTGLKLGKHEFEYEITDAFFAEFEYSLVKKANLYCHVLLDKQETMLILAFNIKGSIDLTCDKCLSQYPQQLAIHEQQIAKFADADIADDEEIITLKKQDFEINVAGLIYEYVNVAMPFITRCNDEGNTQFCDKGTLARLNELAGNSERTEQEDPRWDALKKLK